jgi:hypothetical protein
MKSVKTPATKAKKSYSKPKLTTHGDVRKLTQTSMGSSFRGIGSGIFDGGHDEGHGKSKGRDKH